MILPTRAAERASGQRRPVPGNSPDGRKDYPDFKPSQESLRRSPNRSPRDPGRRSPAVRTTRRAEGPSTLRFLGMTESIGPMWFHNQNHGNLRAGCRLPLVGPRASVSESDGRSASCPSSSMSSGRLILDRVARQQSPSPLHRHPQNNTHPSQTRAEGDISTLPGGRHFYFALTPENYPLQRTSTCDMPLVCHQRSHLPGRPTRRISRKLDVLPMKRSPGRCASRSATRWSRSCSRRWTASY